MSQGFFALPPELRLYVYRELLQSSMSNGVLADIGGLFMTCRQVYAEMGSMIANVQLMLDLHHVLKLTDPSHAPLPIEVPTHYDFIARSLDIAVVVPDDLLTKLPHPDFVVRSPGGMTYASRRLSYIELSAVRNMGMFTAADIGFRSVAHWILNLARLDVKNATSVDVSMDAQDNFLIVHYLACEGDNFVRIGVLDDMSCLLQGMTTGSARSRGLGMRTENSGAVV